MDLFCAVVDPSTGSWSSACGESDGSATRNDARLLYLEERYLTAAPAVRHLRSLSRRQEQQTSE